MRSWVMLYGVASYALFCAVFVYFIGFVGGLGVSKSLATQSTEYSPYALVVNIGLLLIWGLQHSVMARGWFKEKISLMVPNQVERSTYVLASSLVLAMLMICWQPMNGTVWQVTNKTAITLLWSLFVMGWVVALLSTFLTNHFDLFGLRQAWLFFVDKTYTQVKFKERLFYQWIRHPMMLGLLVVFWSLPTMTTGNIVFSIGMSVYIFIGIYYEEKDLARTLGRSYTDYQQRTARILPTIY